MVADVSLRTVCSQIQITDLSVLNVSLDSSKLMTLQDVSLYALAAIHHSTAMNTFTLSVLQSVNLTNTVSWRPNCVVSAQSLTDAQAVMKRMALTMCCVPAALTMKMVYQGSQVMMSSDAQYALRTNTSKMMANASTVGTSLITVAHVHMTSSTHSDVMNALAPLTDCMMRILMSGSDVVASMLSLFT